MLKKSEVLIFYSFLILFSMGEGTRVSVRDYYRDPIHKLLTKDPEAVVDSFVDQQLAFDACVQQFPLIRDRRS